MDNFDNFSMSSPASLLEYDPSRAQTPSTATSVQPDPKSPSSKPRPRRIARKPPQTQTVRYVPGTRFIADYDSVLLTNREDVLAWRDTYGYTDQQLTKVIQFFDQLLQVEGRDTVDEVLAARASAGTWDRLHDLDPLKLFHDREINGVHYPQGVPEDGYRLVGTQPVGRCPHIDRTKPQQPYIRGSTSFYLKNYAMEWDPVPVGTTIADLFKFYPNHCDHEFLDACLMAGISAQNLFSVVHGEAPGLETELRQTGVIGRGQSYNYLHKRMERRMNVLMEKYPPAQVRSYLQEAHGVKLRDSGVFQGKVLRNGTSLVGNVDRWLEKKERLFNNRADESSEATSSAPATPSTPPLDTFMSRVTIAPASPELVDEGLVNRFSVAAMDFHQLPDQPYAQQLRFSLKVEHDSLGHLQGYDFWSSRREYEDHFSKLRAYQQKIAQYTDRIVEHDADVIGRDAVTVRQSTISSMFISGAFQCYTRPLKCVLGEEIDDELLHDQLGAELELLLRPVYGNEFTSSELTPESVHELKTAATHNQLKFHGTQAMVLAFKLVEILHGARRGLLLKCRDMVEFQNVRDVVNGRYAAETRDPEMDELAVALRVFVLRAADKKATSKMSSVARLRLQLDEAFEARRAVDGHAFTFGGPRLSPALRGLCVERYDRIITEFREMLVREQAGPATPGKRGPSEFAAESTVEAGSKRMRSVVSAGDAFVDSPDAVSPRALLPMGNADAVFRSKAPDASDGFEVDGPAYTGLGADFAIDPRLLQLPSADEVEFLFDGGAADDTTRGE